METFEGFSVENILEKYQVTRVGLKWVVVDGAKYLPSRSFWTRHAAEEFAIRLQKAFADGFFCAEGLYRRDE